MQCEGNRADSSLTHVGHAFRKVAVLFLPTYHRSHDHEVQSSRFGCSLRTHQFRFCRIRFTAYGSAAFRGRIRFAANGSAPRLVRSSPDGSTPCCGPATKCVRTSKPCITVEESRWPSRRFSRSAPRSQRNPRPCVPIGVMDWFSDPRGFRDRPVRCRLTRRSRCRWLRRDSARRVSYTAGSKDAGLAECACATLRFNLELEFP